MLRDLYPRQRLPRSSHYSAYCSYYVPYHLRLNSLSTSVYAQERNDPVPERHNQQRDGNVLAYIKSVHLIHCHWLPLSISLIRGVRQFVGPTDEQQISSWVYLVDRYSPVMPYDVFIRNKNLSLVIITNPHTPMVDYHVIFQRKSSTTSSDKPEIKERCRMHILVRSHSIKLLLCCTICIQLIIGNLKIVNVKLIQFKIRLQIRLINYNVSLLRQMILSVLKLR